MAGTDAKNPTGAKKGYAPAGATSGTGTHNYSHADFTYVRKKRGTLIEEEETGELNIVPYLDIMINLIMFLLVAQTTMVSLGMIDATAPSYSAAGPGATPPGSEDKALRLTIGVAREGFFIAAKGGVLPGQEEPTGEEVTSEGIERSKPTIPLLPDGSYDYASLARKLRGIKTAFPKTQAVYIAADALIPYETIVKTLDCSREDARGPLFPAVAFSQIN